MKRVILGAALLAWGVSVASAGATLDRVTASQVMVVATNNDWSPQGFLDKSGTLVGFDIDVATEIASRLRVSVKFVTPEWNAMTGGHWRGRWDAAVASITPTTKRARVLDFPAVYYYSPAVFVVHKDSAITRPEQLNGKRIGVEASTTSEDYVNRRLAIDDPNAPPLIYWLKPGEIKSRSANMPVLDELSLGDGVSLDAVISPEQTALDAIRNGAPLKVVPGDYAFQEPLAVAVDKGDPDWIARLQVVVFGMRADGTLSRLTTKWYGKDYSQ